MKRHLSNEELSNLMNSSIRGKQYVECLQHLESCQDCRARRPELNRAEFIDLIFEDPVFDSNAKELDNETPIPFWNRHFGSLQIGFASILLLIVCGLLLWFYNNKKDPEFVATPSQENTPIKTASPVDTIANNSAPGQTLAATPKDPALARLPDKDEPAPKAAPEPPVQDQFSGDGLDKKELAINLRTIPKPLIDLESPNTMVRGDNKGLKSFVAKYPIGEVIRETQPVLRWNGLKNARSYKVTIYDNDYNELYSGEVQTPNWKVSQALKRGEKYQWQVKANVNEDTTITLPPAIFKVAEDRTVKKIDAARGPNASQWKKANLLFKEGLLNETKKVLDEILRKNPKDKQAAKFLRRVEGLRRRNQNPPTETKPAQ